MVKLLSPIKQFLGILVILTLSISGCKWFKKDTGVDLSEIELDLTIHRFEQELFNIDSLQAEADLAKIRAAYPNFFDLYTERILGIGNIADTPNNVAAILQGFITNSRIIALNDSCQMRFEDVTDLEDELELALKHFKYYFPDNYIPKVVTFISEYGPAIVIADSILGIGIDRFLGVDFSIYRSLPFMHNYVIKTSTKEHIVPYCIKFLVEDLYPATEEMTSLLGHMAHNGKILYALDKLLPKTPDSLKIGYTQKQIEWCVENESNIWAYFISNDLLYETESNKIIRYVTNGPNTSGMPPESPGNIGSLTGWKIIRTFMRRSSEVSLMELMEDDDPSGQRFLSISKYKPKN
ncbi:MAG: hypothetical protein IIA45_10090 [Bacteroidetes bacterium]|nr:hypothetical protein [Bacteroidota bacterium]